MQSFKPLVWLVLSVCWVPDVKAQMNDTAAAVIDAAINDNRIQFGASLRPLRQIAGAPASFYTYFWEFGDGSYSFEKEPVHIYKDTGDYEVRLYATNNYDDGKKPNTRPRKIPVRNRSMLADNRSPNFFTGNGSIEIKSNAMPKPGEDMVLLVGHRRPGSVLLLYNEKQFAQNSFDVADVRRYHQEQPIVLDSMLAWQPSPDEQAPAGHGLFTANGAGAYADRLAMLQQVKQVMSGFRKHQIWRVQGEEQLLFMTVNTLPEMIKDTNAVVTITGLFVPDDPSMELEQFNLELQIVASHDPNRIMLKNKRLNYRFTGKNKENQYKVQFQNTGKGPAKKVAITVTLPGMLNASTIEVTDMKPACVWCDSAYGNQSCLDTVVTKDSIQFNFKNIYLPGTQQEGVSDPDSTMGYIKYQIRFDKKVRKESFTTRAAIVFDKNEPVYTNRSVGRFKKGLSPGIILGFGSGGSPRQQYTLGFTISEYAAYKKYFQWELYVQSFKTVESLVSQRLGGDTMYNGRGYKLNYRNSYEKVKLVSIEAVPVHFRYNIASFVSAGLGAVVNAEWSRHTTTSIRAEVNNPNNAGAFLIEGKTGSALKSFAKWQGGLFGDLQLGRVRVGPAAGIRYTRFFDPGFGRVMVYVSWKI